MTETHDIFPNDKFEAPADETPAPEPTEPEATATTAFLVVVGLDGSVTATSDLETVLVVEREATFGDMRRACQDAVHDINNMMGAERSAMALQSLLQQMAMQQHEATQSEKVRKQLDARGIMVPGR